MKRQVTFLSGVLGALLFTVASILGGLQIEGYSFIGQYISESFASDLPNTGYLRLMYVIAGGSLLIFGVLVPSVLPKSGTLKMAFLLFALFYGLGTITVSLFPCDFGCPTEVESSSLSQLIHNVSAVFTYTITPLLMVAIGVSLRKEADLKGLAKVSLAFGFIALAFVLLLLASPKGPYIGLFQRIVEGSILFWVTYTALRCRNIKN